MNSHALSQQSSSKQEQKEAVSVEVEGGDETAESVRIFFDTNGYFERSKQFIAMFAYTFETDEFSRRD
ncbi:MAG: hypothetical protein ACTJH9_06365 [Pseudoalteromonas sp.]|uniref:hypothetical protein n=1 Tax=unclassified Pseudoalteromonas TaxID=194690 RepID=UPI003F97E808